MMSEKVSENTIDKSGWDDGEWNNEPDKIKWSQTINNYTYKCKIRRTNLGILVGYVVVTKDHPVCDIDGPLDFNVHGGITYCGKNPKDVYSLSDVSKPSDNGEKWLGFDCCHILDYVPNDPVRRIIQTRSVANNSSFYPPSHKIYKNIEFVTNQINSLIEQLETLRENS